MLKSIALSIHKRELSTRAGSIGSTQQKEAVNKRIINERPYTLIE
jgi:hypothetical protein